MKFFYLIFLVFDFVKIIGFFIFIFYFYDVKFFIFFFEYYDVEILVIWVNFKDNFIYVVKNFKDLKWIQFFVVGFNDVFLVGFDVFKVKIIIGFGLYDKMVVEYVLGLLFNVVRRFYEMRDY